VPHTGGGSAGVLTRYLRVARPGKTVHGDATSYREAAPLSLLFSLCTGGLGSSGLRIAAIGLARGDRKWSLHDGQIPNFHGVRVALGSGYYRVEGSRRLERSPPTHQFATFSSLYALWAASLTRVETMTSSSAPAGVVNLSASLSSGTRSSDAAAGANVAERPYLTRRDASHPTGGGHARYAPRPPCLRGRARTSAPGGWKIHCLQTTPAETGDAIQLNTVPCFACYTVLCSPGWLSRTAVSSAEKVEGEQLLPTHGATSAATGTLLLTLALAPSLRQLAASARRHAVRDGGAVCDVCGRHPTGELRARWVTLRARWVMLRARWVMLRGSGAILQARVGRLVYGAPNYLLGGDGSWVQLFNIPRRSEPGECSGSSDVPSALTAHPFQPQGERPRRNPPLA
jgi:hypothetical protein